LATKRKNTNRGRVDNGRSSKRNWPLVKFGDVVTDVNESERDPLGVGLERFVGLGHFESQNLWLREWGLLVDEEVSFTKRFRKGQVLFGKRRAYQRKVAIAEFDGVCSSDILTFQSKGDALLPELLPFIVQSDAFFDHALGTSSGSLSPRTRWSQLKDFRFPLPPLTEQPKIAELLWAANDVIEAHRDLVANLGICKATLAAHFWRMGIGHTEFQDTAIGRLPTSWRVAPLSELTDEWAHGPRFPAEDYCEDGNVRTVRTTDFDRRGALDVTTAPAAQVPAEVIEKHRLMPGEFLFSRSGQYSGLTATFEETRGCFIAAAFLIRFKLKSSVLSKYLVQLFYSDFGSTYVLPLRRGTYQQNISGSAVLALNIPVPPIDEQQHICRVLEECESGIVRANRQLLQSIELARAIANEVVGEPAPTAELADV
jgi:type I restriction enzyme S subunit